VAGGNGLRAISSLHAHDEPKTPQHLGKLALLKNLRSVNFVRTTVEGTDAPEGGNLAGQRVAGTILDLVNEHDPIGSGPKYHSRARAGTEGFQNVENENATRAECLVRAGEQFVEPGQSVRGVEEIVQAFPGARDGIAFRKRRIEKRSQSESGGRRALPRQLEHRRRDVDAQNTVAGGDKNLRQHSRAAANIDDQSVSYSMPPENPQEFASRRPCKDGESVVVDVREIVAVGM